MLFSNGLSKTDSGLVEDDIKKEFVEMLCIQHFGFLSFPIRNHTAYLSVILLMKRKDSEKES